MLTKFQNGKSLKLPLIRSLYKASILSFLVAILICERMGCALKN